MVIYRRSKRERLSNTEFNDRKTMILKIRPDKDHIEKDRKDIGKQRLDNKPKIELTNQKQKI